MTQKLRNHPDLLQIARAAMLSRGFEPDFAPEALKQLEGIHEAALETTPAQDLTELLWWAASQIW